MKKQRKRDWHWVEWVLFGAYTMWFAMGILFLFTRGEEIGNPPIALFTILFFICYVSIFLFWRPGYVHGNAVAVTALLTTGSLNIYITYSAQQYVSLLILPLLVVAFLIPLRSLFWAAPLYILGYSLMQTAFVSEPSSTNTLGLMFDMTLMMAIGVSLGQIVDANYRSRKLLEENREQYKLIIEQMNALQQYADKIEHLTLVEERNRLARELHDTVGHTFTSVIMGMDAVSYLMDTSPEQAKQKLEVLRSVTRDGLEAIRMHIHQIAPDEDELSLSASLMRISEEFGTHTGTLITMTTEGMECDTIDQIKLTLIRCLQESLTNAKRHGHASSIEVKLIYRQNDIVLRIADEGRGIDGSQRGFGLTSMEERLRTLQGSLEVKSLQNQGTTLTCTVPMIRRILVAQGGEAV
jgi:signal transduction histidine kinase